MGAAETAEASVGMLSTTDRLKEGKKLQVHCLRIISPESPAKLYGCYAVIAVLTAAVIALTVTLSAKEEQFSSKTTYAVCPRDWVGFGSKCFYFSENTSNWTFGHTFCMEREAHLARFDSLEELDFLKRYKGIFDYWIGLHRNSSSKPWRWADNTEYNSLVPIRGWEECAYLKNNGISSAWMHAERRWICSKPNSYILQCQIPFSPL